MDSCVATIAPGRECRLFSARTARHELPLAATYQEMLAGLGPRTRRSLATKRRQLETRAQVVFVASLSPAEALRAMLYLCPRSLPQRAAGFYRARYRLLCQRPSFFSMAMRLPNGDCLSLLSGWRENDTTYVDLQMNDKHYKQESLSAVMRAFMLEHEIATGQRRLHFVGGSSLLLERYCHPAEPCTDAFLWRPCLRAILLRTVIPRIQRGSIYDRMIKGLPGRTLGDS